MIPEAVAALFREEVRFVPVTEQINGDDHVRVEQLASNEDGPRYLKGENLPLLTVPPESDPASAMTGQVVVAVEGADHLMAGAIARYLSTTAAIALVHVTWLPGIVSSPVDEGGIDDPHPQDLLAYRGAREALVDTANELRRAGFQVTTHLREHRDPALPIGEFCKTTGADLLVLGLGRHGAGIGRRLSQLLSIPQLFLKAR